MDGRASGRNAVPCSNETVNTHPIILYKADIGCCDSIERSQQPIVVFFGKTKGVISFLEEVCYNEHYVKIVAGRKVFYG